MEGLGWGPADKPDAFLAAGVEETGDFPEANLGYPGFDLGNRGAAGREDDPGLLAGDPAGLDPGEAALARIRMNAEFQTAGWKFGPVSPHGRFQPAPGGRIIVLRKNPSGTGKTGFPGREVGTEKKLIAPFHLAGNTAKERERIEIGQDTKKSEQARTGEMRDRRWETGGEIDLADNFSSPG